MSTHPVHLHVSRSDATPLGNPYPYDYETKYPKDEEGEELTANARIWRVLLDEGKVRDARTVQSWRDTADIYLVFVRVYYYWDRTHVC